jgi:hypothetical protein
MVLCPGIFREKDKDRFQNGGIMLGLCGGSREGTPLTDHFQHWGDVRAHFEKTGESPRERCEGDLVLRAVNGTNRSAFQA